MERERMRERGIRGTQKKESKIDEDRERGSEREKQTDR